MLTAQTWDQVTSKRRLSGEEMEKQRQLVIQNASAYSVEITHILNSCPRELLLVLKTNDCLRSLTSRLGWPADTYLTMSRYCLERMSTHRIQKHPDSWWERLRSSYRWLSLEARLTAA